MTAPATTIAPRRAAGPSRIGILVRQAVAELRSNLRAPDFAAGVLALPIVLYLVFGAPRVTEPMPGGTVGAYLVVAFCIYGTLSVVLFGIGQAVADERGRGYVRLIRTTPLPTSAYLGAKLVLAAVLTVLSVITVGIAGAVTGAGLPLDRWLAMAGVLVAGGLALAPIGFLVGFMVRPSAAGAVSLLLLFPLSLASGVFMTVESLPDVVAHDQPVHPHLPPVRARPGRSRLRDRLRPTPARRLDRRLVPRRYDRHDRRLPPARRPPVLLSRSLRPCSTTRGARLRWAR